MLACDLVWAEVGSAFADAAAARKALDGLEVSFDGVDAEIALAAGLAWGEYRSAGGTRRRILPDFLIGAHAVSRAERLLTRDRGFYRLSFAGLAVLEP